MADRRALIRDRVSRARSLAGTVVERVRGRDELPETEADRRREFRDARKEAERDRIREEARKEARKKARERRREELREQLTEEELERLRNQQGADDGGGRLDRLKSALAKAGAAVEGAGGGDGRRAPAGGDRGREEVRRAGRVAQVGPVEDATLDPMGQPERLRGMAGGMGASRVDDLVLTKDDRDPGVGFFGELYEPGGMFSIESPFFPADANDPGLGDSVGGGLAELDLLGMDGGNQRGKKDDEFQFF